MIDRSIFRYVCSIDISYLSTFEWHKINTWQVDSYWHEYLTSRQLLKRISDKSTVIGTNIWQVHSKSHEYLTSRRLIDKKLIWNDTNIKHLTCRQLSDTNMWHVDTKNPLIIRQNPLTFRQFIDRHKDLTNQKYTSHIERYLTEWEKTTLIF